MISLINSVIASAFPGQSIRNFDDLRQQSHLSFGPTARPGGGDQRKPTARREPTTRSGGGGLKVPVRSLDAFLTNKWFFRSHNEAGFEHVFQLDLPPRPKILHRDPAVDETVWKKFRSLSGNDGRIADVHGLKSLVFRGGIVPEMRPKIWKYMLGYYKWECSDAENEKVYLHMS
jgi:hypothetical protein